VVNRWRVILAAAVIFLAGAGTGAVVVRTYAPKIVKRTHISPPLPIGEDRRREYVEKLNRELHLTAEQRAQTEQILVESQERMKTIWDPIAGDVKDEYRRTRKEIWEILTPEQQAKMKTWRKGDKGDKGEDKKEDASQRNCTKDQCCL
jgi:Spy/CpxP family protein refolding chaperone